jgi:hypothetical protein
MELVQEFFRDKSPARLMMIAAIVLLFVSQFFLYLNDPGGGYIPNAMNLEEYTRVVITSFGAVGTGWELHPHAYVILIVLAFAFLRDDIVESPIFSKAGWWVSLILFVVAILPGAPLRDAPGAAMGGIAALIALAAVLVHLAEARQQKAAAKQSAGDPPA